MSIKVVAKANGYYGSKIRQPGEEFVIDKPEDFSGEWMITEDGKVKAHLKKVAAEKADVAEVKLAPQPSPVNARAERAKGWLSNLDDEDPDEVKAPALRHVNTGGTDGVVGGVVPTAGAKLSAKERIAAAKELTGRDDITSAKEADTILASAGGGSDNDDRSRDFASDASNDAPAPDEAGSNDEI